MTHNLFPSSGRLASRDDGRGAVGYSYDSAGRLQTVTPYGGGGPGTTYSYDENGNVTSATDGTATVGYQYDSLDRLDRVDYNDPVKHVEYAYDGSGLRTSMLDPEGVAVSYGYDSAGRLVTVQRASDPAAVYEYDFAGRRTRLTLPNGCYTVYGYDGAGRLTSVTNRKSDDTLISSFAYTLDDVGNRTAMAQALGGVSHELLYGYDDLYRLTSETRRLGETAVASQSFTYDGVGNRIAHTGFNVTGNGETVDETYSYNAANQLTKIVVPGEPDTDFLYDAAGNQVGMTKGTDVRTYAFDYRNRMTGFSGLGVTASYAFYPHHWARRSKTVDDVTTRFLYDGDNVVAEYDSAGGAEAAYVTPFLDQNLTMTRGGQTYFYMHDGLGSVRNLLDSSQIEQNRYDYEAFGQPYAPGTSVTVEQPFTFTARRSDAESSLMHYRCRQYNPKAGRFLGRDPLRYAGLTCLYCYAWNAPLLLVDPYGMDDIRIKEGTANVVQWMPETWYGGDLPNQAIDLGVVDANGVVRFSPELGLGEMPYDILQDLGGADSFAELRTAITDTQRKAMEAKGRYKEGYHVADYYSFKVTCEECRDLGDIGAKLACRARIAGSLGTPIASRFASGGMEAGVGVVVGTTGAAILFSVGASQAWNPVGWAALGVGGIIAVKGAWDIGQAFRIKAAVNGAIDTYCDCSDLR